MISLKLMIAGGVRLGVKYFYYLVRYCFEALLEYPVC